MDFSWDGFLISNGDFPGKEEILRHCLQKRDTPDTHCGWGQFGFRHLFVCHSIQIKGPQSIVNSKSTFQRPGLPCLPFIPGNLMDPMHISNS